MLDHKDLVVHLDQPEQQVELDHKEEEDQVVCEDQVERQETEASQVQLEILDHVEVLVHLESVEKLEDQVPQVQLEELDQLDPLDLQDHKEFEELRATLEQQALKDLEARMGQVDH